MCGGLGSIDNPAEILNKKLRYKCSIKKNAVKVTDGNENFALKLMQKIERTKNYLKTKCRICVRMNR